MQGLANRDVRASLGRMVGDHQRAAGLKRCEQDAIHLGTIDVHVRRVVIKEQKSNRIEIVHVRRQWIIEGSR
jgi:hypothetical protein